VSGVALVPIASIVDGEALLDTAIASLIAGVGVTLIASLAIYGFATFVEARRDGRTLAATGAGALAVLASLAFAGLIAAGLAVMIGG